jgi:hypothetical protein
VESAQVSMGFWDCMPYVVSWPGSGNKTLGTC